MGRFLGSFMDDNELERPDLNKCPDCECYFPQDKCPICGRECPEEMRAGNRKIQKKKKQRNGRSNHRVYVDWYHKWWFIIPMLIIFPILGFILLASSPYNKTLKTTVMVVAIIYAIVSFFGIGNIIDAVNFRFEKPVDTSLSYEEYIGKCEEISVEEYYRRPDDYKESFIKTELKVTELFSDYNSSYKKVKYSDYYICTGIDGDGEQFSIIVRNCVQSGIKNLAPGDVITVYGECVGRVEVNDLSFELQVGPCINAAYFELLE